MPLSLAECIQRYSKSGVFNEIWKAEAWAKEVLFKIVLIPVIFFKNCRVMKSKVQSENIHSISLVQAFLRQSLGLVGKPALGKVLVIPKSLDFQMMEATVLTGIFHAAEFFLYPSPDQCLDTTLSLRSTENSLDFLTWFVL